MELELHYNIHKSPPLVPIPSQINLVHFNIILLCTRRYPQLSLSIGFLNNKLFIYLTSKVHHLPILSHLSCIIIREIQTMNWTQTAQSVWRLATQNCLGKNPGVGKEQSPIHTRVHQLWGTLNHL